MFQIINVGKRDFKIRAKKLSLDYTYLGTIISFIIMAKNIGSWRYMGHFCGVTIIFI